MKRFKWILVITTMILTVSACKKNEVVDAKELFAYAPSGNSAYNVTTVNIALLRNEVLMGTTMRFPVLLSRAFDEDVTVTAQIDTAGLKTYDSIYKVSLPRFTASNFKIDQLGQVLPLIPGKVKKIIVLGEPEAVSIYGGKGSGAVKGFDHVDYFDGLKNVYGNKVIKGDGVSESEIKTADAILFFAHKVVGEGGDYDFNLPEQTQRQIEKYSLINKNTIVVYSSGNPMDMPWLDRVKGLIYAYFLGQYRGTALANIISGKMNPSGKLPYSIEKKFSNSPARDYNLMADGKYYWGGTKPHSQKMKEQFGDLQYEYKEGIYIGYRWFDKKGIEPQFPFGYGLSYSTFEYSGINTNVSSFNKNGKMHISFTIKNTGNYDGAEVAQLYMHPINSKVDRPVKELKVFQKVFLKAGETKKVSLAIEHQDLSYWDEQTHSWKVDDSIGYELQIGSSSKDIRLKKEIRIK